MYKLIPSVLVVLLCVGIARTKYEYQMGHLPVLVDQFSLSDSRTFQLRYLYNNSFYMEDAPIFFYAGAEGNIEIMAENTGYLWEVAIQFKAFVLFIEHRYYGKSLPFGDESFKTSANFDYLTTAQALSDFVDVINHVKWDILKLKPGKDIVPVIAFGGSLGGLMAIWMRMKYPSVVQGVLASSSPLWAFPGSQLQCDGFTKVLTAAFERNGPECVKNIRKSWDMLDRVKNSADDRQWLNDNWKLCTPLKTIEDVQRLTGWVLLIYSILGTYNHPYPTDILVKFPANPVKLFCSYLNTPLDEKPLLAALCQSIHATFLYGDQSKCIDWTRNSFGSVGEGYNIQGCSEIIMPSCATGVTDMFFPLSWNFTDYSETCLQTYGIRPREFLITKQYGGRDIDTLSNIIFSNGLLDPWSSYGVLESVSPKTYVVVMENAAHRLDLRASNPNDPPEVVKARNEYASIFVLWIREYRDECRVPASPYDEYLSCLDKTIPKS